MNPDPDRWLEDLADLLVPHLEARGFTRHAGTLSPGASIYDADTCRRFFSPAHIGDNVLQRARSFFAYLDQHGEVDSLDVVEMLELKGPTSIPANLTNPLKKSAKRLGLDEPWDWGENPDGTRTLWSDRDGIAAQMVAAIDDERARRGLT